MEPAARSERATLSRDLSDFFVELSIALHRHSMYPTGHPALVPAIEAVTRRAERLLQERPSIAFAVARRQLIIDDVSTDPDHPVLRRLADSLHRHHVGAISITRGLESEELGEALLALSAEADREGPLGLKPDLPGWPHVKLHPMTFDGLSIAGEAGADSQRSPHGADLWVGLAKAALAFDGAPASEGSKGQPVPSETAIAKAIDENTDHDQMVIGHLRQIARELQTASGDAGEELKQRTSKLIASLKPDTLRRLVAMGGDVHQRSQFVFDVTHGMAVGAVLQIVQASADAGGQTISHGLVRMLTKLAKHAESGSELARPRAEAELREQVGRLLEDWRLEDPNPEAYGRLLQHMATAPGTETTRRKWADAAVLEPLRLVKMSLEAGAMGPLSDRAIDQAINAGQLNELLDLIAAPPAGSQAGADMILAKLTRPETLRGIVTGDRIDAASLDQLLPRLPVEGYEPLLEVLCSSPSRIVRRRLLDLLGRTQVDITPLVVARLSDQRWYVQRNMLTLLTRSRHLPPTFSAAPWIQHPDARVRAEAIRVQLMQPHERHLGVRAALIDPDPRIVHLGLTALRDDCPAALIDRVIDLAVAWDLGYDSRVLAVNALSRQRDENVLAAFLHLSVAGRSILRRTRLVPKTPVLVAVVRALATTWASDSRAAGVLAAAARSSDPELRAAASTPNT